MTRLLFFHGDLFMPAIALLGLLLGGAWVWRRFARRRLQSAWRPTTLQLGDVVLDGTVDADHRLPRGRVLDRSGLTAGRLWLKLRDGTRIALEGPVGVLDRVPAIDDDPEIQPDLRANHPVRVRARLAPSKTATTVAEVAPSGGPYRVDSRGLSLVPRGEHIELASRRCPGRVLLRGALLGGLVGATLGLFVPGFGLVLGAPDAALASPLFRMQAITTLASDAEEALREADDDWAARHIVRYLLLRRERDGTLCPDEIPGAPSAFVMAEVAAHCRRPQWLRTYVETNHTRLAPARAHTWLARATELGASADPSFAYTEARIMLTSGAELGPSFEALRWQLPPATRCAFESSDDQRSGECWWRALMRARSGESVGPGVLDVFAPALFEGRRWDADEAHLIALALGRCGADDAQAWCDKQLDRTFEPPHLAARDSARAVIDRGAFFAHLHARSAGLDPRIRRALAERALAFELMVAPTERLVDHARVIARALEALPEPASEFPRTPKPPTWDMRPPPPRRVVSARPRMTSVEVLAQVAAWRGEPDAFGVFRGRLSDVGGRLGRGQAPLPPARLDDSPEAFVRYALHRGERLPAERCIEDVPTGYALDVVLHSRRWHHARCGETPAHDARVEALMVGYGDAERSLLLAALDEAEHPTGLDLGSGPVVRPVIRPPPVWSPPDGRHHPEPVDPPPTSMTSMTYMENPYGAQDFGEQSAGYRMPRQPRPAPSPIGQGGYE